MMNSLIDLTVESQPALGLAFFPKHLVRFCFLPEPMGTDGKKGVRTCQTRVQSRQHYASILRFLAKLSFQSQDTPLKFLTKSSANSIFSGKAMLPRGGQTMGKLTPASTTCWWVTSPAL